MTADRHLEVYKDKAAEWRWRRVATGNGDRVADSGEGYTEANDAEEAARRENPDVEDVRRVE